VESDFVALHINPDQRPPYSRTTPGLPHCAMLTPRDSFARNRRGDSQMSVRRCAGHKGVSGRGYAGRHRQVRAMNLLLPTPGECDGA
jgi:hypothetical protein